MKTKAKAKLKRKDSAREATAGRIALSGQDGPLFKNALLCRTGNFDGMYGPVEVTKERLERLAAKYNSSRAKPANEHDYAPILVDHNRSAELVKGRILTPIKVKPWADPETGVEEFGMFAPLRIDRDQDKVESGQYSQLSISFDEDSDELFEVSFVGVEAARRSQVLSKGEKKMSLKVQKRLSSLQAQHAKLEKSAQAALAVKKAACTSLQANLKAALSDAGTVITELAAVAVKLRTGALKSQFKCLLRSGKLNKAEFDKIDYAKLSALPATALKAVVESYDARPVSTDVVQFGQDGAKPSEKVLSLTPAQIRAGLKAGKGGKKAALAADDEPGSDAPAKKKPSDSEGGDDKGDEGNSEFKLEDIDEALSAMDGMGPTIEKVATAMKRMNKTLRQFMGETEKGDEK